MRLWPLLRAIAFLPLIAHNAFTPLVTNMASATFDTLKFANALKAVGVPDRQAESQSQFFSEMFSINFREVEDIEGRLRELEQRFLANARSDMICEKLDRVMMHIRWMLAVLIFLAFVSTLFLI